MLKELAIFQHFYNLSREEALKLECWYWDNLIAQYYSINADKHLNALYCTASGFNGGDSFKAVEKILTQQINAPIATKRDLLNSSTVSNTELEEDYGNEETLSAWDMFLSASGL